MRARAITTAAAIAAATLAWAVAPAPPAGAVVTVTSSGTTVLATITGGSSGINTSCVGGSVRVANVAATPPVACSALTTLTVRGDDNGQIVNLGGAGAPTFPALTLILSDLRGGSDLVFGSPVPDLVLGGTGTDQAFLDTTGADDSTVNMGGDAGDSVTFTATAGADVVDLDTTSSTRTLVTSGSWQAPVFGAPFIGVSGGAGDDTVDASGLDATTDVLGFSADGGAGDDELRGGFPTSTLGGGPGTNQLVGGPGHDILVTESTTDQVDGLGGADLVRDTGSGRVGGRALTLGPTPEDDWQVVLSGDTAVRARASGSAPVVDAMLSRTGEQLLGTGVNEITYALDQVGDPVDRAVLDLHPLTAARQRVQASGTQAVVDITVPSGSWTVTGSTVTFTDGYQPILVAGGGPIFVHAPYSDANGRWAHRAVRDLEMRIPSTGERDAYASQLTAGTRTRTQIATSLTSTDVYRALAVDRAFVDILRRGTDAGGRAYWVERLRDGLVTRRLRANLYGSPEYVTEQGGGTNPGYVAAAYRDILGRTAGSSEVAYWVDQIEDVGLPRGTVADRFLNTPEARTVVIRDLFLRFAFREPTGAELTTWNTALASSSTDGEVALVRFLVASAVYYGAG